jgi:glycosyltransferase involved in cell wall biosynthesis
MFDSMNLPLPDKARSEQAPLVSVGVPVYNGAQWLEASLTCLRDQTHRNIEVWIYDNCSDDATPEIAKRFCAGDARFHYFRQPENKGPKRNFLDVLEAARSPYFMWRAADDTSDLNYIEVLLDLLLAHPGHDLAASRGVSVSPDGRVLGVYELPPRMERGEGSAWSTQLFMLNAGWFYGVFRREAMLRFLPEVLDAYPYLPGWDVVALIPFAFDCKVVGTNKTSWLNYVRAPQPRPDRGQRAVMDVRKYDRLNFVLKYAHRHVDRAAKSPLSRAFYHAMVWYYGLTRGLTLSKRLRIRLKQTIGAAPPLSSQREFTPR